jgi:peptide/nickel transport system substrate-binding protein
MAAARALAGALLFALGCGSSEETNEAPPKPGEVPAAAETGPVRGDWLVLHLLADPENLNPLTSNDASSSEVLSWMFPSLMRIERETAELEPLIASEAPEVAEDKLTYTYRLRPEVTYSDGRPVTAEDVVFALKAAKHPQVNAPHTRNYLNSVRDAVAVDTHTVRISLSEKYFLNDYVLGGQAPLPRHYYDPENLLEGISVADLADPDRLPPEKQDRARRFAKAFNEGFHRNPMGPGAYVLRNPETDLVTGQKIVLHRRDDYWAPDRPELEFGWVDRIVYRIINDSEAALVALKSGDLDVLGLRPIQHLKQTDTPRFREQFDKNAEIRGGFTYIGWNQGRALFRDRTVRRALSHLVDKRNIIDKVMLGLGVPVESPIFVGRPEHNQDLAPWPFDPEKAKRLLAEAGWSDTDGDGILDKELDGERVPLRFEIISNSGNEERKNVGLVVIDEFKRAGIDASFRGVDWSILLEKVKSFDYDAVVLGWTGGGTQPPDAYQIWHSTQAIAGGSNFIQYKNPEVDRILEAYRVEFDAAERKRLYDRFQEILYDEQPYTFLYTPQAITAWDRRFQGVRWYPGRGTDLHEWWVPLARQKYD